MLAQVVAAAHCRGDCRGKDGRAVRAVKTDALCGVWEVIWKIAHGTVKKKIEVTKPYFSYGQFLLYATR